MKLELQHKIFNTYPKLFDTYHSKSSGIMPIKFGIETNDGWYVIIDSLFELIDHYIKNKIKYPKKVIKSNFWKWWFNIVDKMPYKYGKKFNGIKTKIKMKTLPVPTIDIIQIKEKFGGLRIYFNGGDDNINGMIEMAIEIANNTCEICGSTENVGMTQGWYVTCCKSCFELKKTNLKVWKNNKTDEIIKLTSKI